MSETPRLSSLKYQVTSVLDTDDGTTVLLVSDREVGGGSYALKVIRREGTDDDLAIERARAECEASEKLHYPSILEVHDFRVRRSWFVVRRAELLMEYVEGRPLSALEGLPVGAATLVFQKTAAALAHMHRRGVLHGDVRPSRILLARTGQVKVRGYGLSLVHDKFKGLIKTEGAYAAPERGKGGIDKHTDIYGLGATMYRVLTGQPPGGPQGRAEGQKLTKPFALNPKISTALNDLIIACLQTKPERRPPHMAEIAAQLEAMAKGLALKEGDLAGLAAEKT